MYFESPFPRLLLSECCKDCVSLKTKPQFTGNIIAVFFFFAIHGENLSRHGFIGELSISPSGTSMYIE